MQHLESPSSPFLSPLNNNNSIKLETEENAETDAAAAAAAAAAAFSAQHSPNQQNNMSGNIDAIKSKLRMQPDFAAAVVAAAAAAADSNADDVKGPDSKRASSDHPLFSGNDLYQSADEKAVMEADKRKIYKHPLFPLLGLLLEKCEIATQSSECPKADEVNRDIQAFFQMQNDQNSDEAKPTNNFQTDNPELDELMLQAILVLRIHVLELEKVQELCQDFCNRYIQCLKGKMQSENLLRSDYGGSGYDSDDSGGRSSVMTPQHHMAHAAHSHQQLAAAAAAAAAAQQHPMHHPQQPVQGATAAAQHMLHPQTAALMGHYYPAMHHNAISSSSGIVLNHHHQWFQTNSSHPECNNWYQYHHHNNNVGYGSNNYWEQISHNEDIYNNKASSSNSTSPSSPTYLDRTSHQSPGSSSSKSNPGTSDNKRGILPKKATKVLKAWLFQHVLHPYPTEDQKRDLAIQTGLSLLQVNNWFINARRRIVQPMLEVTSPESIKRKARPANGKPPVLRFWPESLQMLGQQQQMHNNGSGGKSSLDSDVESDLLDDESTCSSSGVSTVCQHN